MTEPRLAAGMIVGALLRRIAAAGGSGAVIARGDETAGAILLMACDRGQFHAFLERAPRSDGGYGWAQTGPENTQNQDVVNDYIARRRRADPDIWVIELDIARVERFAAEMMSEG